MIYHKSTCRGLHIPGSGYAVAAIAVSVCAESAKGESHSFSTRQNAATDGRLVNAVLTIVTIHNTILT